MSVQKATPAMEDDQIDAAILEVLLDDQVQRPWAVDEISRELEDPIAAADGLDRLARAGLVHRLDGGFVLPSRAALRMVEIIPNELR
jgi:hypothetical protein